MSNKKSLKRNWMSKSSACNGLFQSGTRVDEISSLGFVAMSVHWSIHTFLGYQIQLSKYIALIAHVRFKVFSLFSFEHVGSNIEI